MSEQEEKKPTTDQRLKELERFAEEQQTQIASLEQRVETLLAWVHR